VALATRFGASRTPVREALRKLAARGLVDSIPRRGVVVARIGLEELSDMLEAECEMEALCARLSSQKMSALEKQHLQLIHDRACALVTKADSFVDYTVINEQFHNLVAAGSRNKTLMVSVSALRDRLAPFRQAQWDEMKPRLIRSTEDHRHIVNAIMEGNAEAAYLAMRDHNARLSTAVLVRLHEQENLQNSYHDMPQDPAPAHSNLKIRSSISPARGSRSTQKIKQKTNSKR